MNRKRYTHTCVILESIGGKNLVVDTDEGGISIDPKTNNKRFFLKKGNVGLDPDSIPWFPRKDGKPIVFLLKFGLKNYKYVNMKFFDSDSYKIEVGEEDVNWALNSYARAKALFNTTLLQQILPYIGIMLMGIFIVIMLVIVFNKISVLNDVAVALQHVADTLIQLKSGTTVLPG
jgi:hypothetical protein